MSIRSKKNPIDESLPIIVGEYIDLGNIMDPFNEPTVIIQVPTWLIHHSNPTLINETEVELISTLNNVWDDL